MSDPIKTSSKGDSGGKTSGRGFIADRYFRLSVTALIFVAFAFGNFEYITGKHRPDPFAWVEPGISWAWWRHPLPEESVEVMPWPVGRYGKFIERNENYSESHLSVIGPGEVNAKLGGVEIELADFAPFADGSAWALDTNGKLYSRVAEADWQERSINQIHRLEQRQAVPRISGRILATPENIAPVTWAGFTPRGDTVIVTTEEGEVLAWSVSKGDWVWREFLKIGRTGTPGFAPNQPLMMIPGKFGIVLMDWTSGNITNRIETLKAAYRAAAFVGNDEILTWDEASGFQLWATGTGQPIGRPDFGIKEEVNRIVVSPDGKFVAIGTQFAIFVGDYQSGNSFRSIIAEKGFQVRNFAFTADSTGLIYRDESSIQIVDIESGRSERVWRPSQVLYWAPANNIILGQEGKGGLTLWQYQDDDFSRFDVYGGNMVASLSTAGDLIAVQTDREPILVFGRRERGISTQIDYFGERIRQISFSAEGNVLMVLQESGDLNLWDVGLDLPQTKSVEVPIEVAEQNIRAQHFINSRTGWVISDQEQLLTTKDAGNTWLQPAGTPEPREGVVEKLNDVHFVSQLTGWVVGDAGLVARTTDGGANWTLAESSSNANLYAVHFVNQDIGVAVGEKGTVLRSTDGGQSWARINVTLDQELRSVTLLPEGSGWISALKSGDNLAPTLKTTDSGATWQQVDFSELPAPLLLFIGIPLFALAVFVVFYQKTQIVEAIGVDPVGTSDKPIGWDDPDPLHFKPVAKGLSYFLRNQDTEPPLTIGINGPWGTGKSSLMNLVMEDLSQYGCSPVWFNAWHHQKEEHLLAALLENIRKQAVPKLWQRGGIKFRLRLFWLRTRGEVKIAASIALVILGLVLLDRLFSGGGLLRAIPNIDLISLNLVPELLRENLTKEAGVASSSLLFLGWLLFRLQVLPSDPAKLLAGLGDRVSVRGLRDQLGFRYKFGGEFNQVCTALRSRSSPGLVILIDDLDRCQPPNVLEVLEAVNYLATVGDCFIILGMARRQVENCVAIGFKDFIVEGMEDEDHGLLQVDSLQESNLADPEASNTSAENPNAEAEERTHATDNQRRFARRYLEKMINIEVAVPRGNPDQAVGLFAREKSGSGSDSRLGQRKLLHKLSGLVQIVALVLLLGIIGAGVAPLLPQGDGKDPGIGTDEVRNRTLQDAVEVLTGTDSNAIRDPPVAQTETGTTELVIGAAPPIRISPVPKAVMTKSRSPWTWWGPPALIFAMIMIFLLRRRLRPADTNIEDTEGFTEALKRWYPLIYAVNPTPRAIKRFENRIRYIAMQARPPQQTPDFIDRIIDWTEKYWFRFRRRQAPQAESEETGIEDSEFKIDDEMLVALGAVEALDVTTIQEKGADEISQLVSASTADLLKRMQATEPKDDDKFVEQLNRLNQFIGAGKDWPPNAQDLSDYRRLSGQIRG